MRAKEKKDFSAKEPQKKRGRKRQYSSPLAPPVPLSFFKVLIGDFRNVLFIPPAVACTFKDMAEKYVNLEDSDCNSWIVKMSMIEGCLAFEKGWHEFVMAHSISVGEFVIFTYLGELMFTARIFGTSSMERLNFQTKKCKSRKDMIIAKLKSKRRKTCKTSDDKHSPVAQDLLRLERERRTAPCDLRKVKENGSDSISARVSEAPSILEKSLHHHTGSKVYNKTVEHGSLALEELNLVNNSELLKSDGENLEVFVPKSSRKKVGVTEQAAGKPYIEGSTPVVLERVVEDKMRINGKINRNISYDFKMLDNDPDNEITAAFSNITDTKCTPKMEGFSDELFHKAGLSDAVGEEATYLKMEEAGLEEFPDELCDKAEGLCDIVEEKLKNFEKCSGIVEPGNEDSSSDNTHVNFCSETHALCEIEPPIPSTPALNYTRDKEENMIPTSEEVDTQIKDMDENNATPCSYRRSRVNIEKEKIERTESDDIPSPTHQSSTIQLSHDVQNFIELPEELICRFGRMKLERKVVVLQDPLMRNWPVLYHQSFNYVGFIGGWADFARANCICKGDICELELLDEKELVFGVQIRKA